MQAREGWEATITGSPASDPHRFEDDAQLLGIHGTTWARISVSRGCMFDSLQRPTTSISYYCCTTMTTIARLRIRCRSNSLPLPPQSRRHSRGITAKSRYAPHEPNPRFSFVESDRLTSPNVHAGKKLQYIPAPFLLRKPGWQPG
jgi:hypothetical protein